MAKKDKENGLTFKLSDGTEVLLRKGTGADVIKARKQTNDQNLMEISLASILGTFNGEVKPFMELINLPADDFLLIEIKIRELLETKNFLEQGMS